MKKNNLRAQFLSMRKRDQESLERLIPNPILNLRVGGCGRDVQQCPVRALSSGSLVGCGEKQLCCLPGHQPGTKNDKHLMGAFEDGCFITVGLQT